MRSTKLSIKLFSGLTPYPENVHHSNVSNLAKFRGFIKKEKIDHFLVVSSWMTFGRFVMTSLFTFLLICIRLCVLKETC